jgi:two-component system, NarL family, sensor histidine kinase DesK
MRKGSLQPPFLPANGEHGWMPYLWLVYSLPFAVSPAFTGGQWWRWAATLVGYAAFLVVYFSGYRVSGRRLRLYHAGALCLLACVLAPLSTTALVFFIYASSSCGEIDEPRRALPNIAGIMVVEAALIVVLRPHLMAWLPPAVFTPLVGLMVMHYAQRRRLTQRLLVTQGELSRMAQIAERERIARDLHDLLGHTLSVIVLKSELASRLAETDAGRALAEIRDVERISRDALKEVRTAVLGYRSSGLAAEVEQARQALLAAGIRLEDSVPSMELRAAQEGVLALAIREGCTNVLRHAQAKICRVALRQVGTEFELEIADDGRGGTAAEGLGLRGMRERVEAMGGSMVQDGTKGMRLVLRLPLGLSGEMDRV